MNFLKFLTVLILGFLGVGLLWGLAGFAASEGQNAIGIVLFASGFLAAGWVSDQAGRLW